MSENKNRYYFFINNSNSNMKFIFFSPLYKIYCIYDKSFKKEELEKILKECEKVENGIKNEISKLSCERKILNRLVLGISNVCNLKCIYCYAGGGTYGSYPSIMNSKIAENIINKLITNFDTIKNIQFFGGEPLLGYKTIEFVCEYFTLLYSSKKIKKIPSFSIVTNGTIINDKIIEILKKYKIYVTVSLDGPPQINNLLRKKYNEEKISEIVVKNIKRLQQEGIKIGIEATYTNYHLQQGFTVWDCINYFNKEFGIASIHIPPVSVKKNHSNFSWRIFPEHLDLCIKSYTGAIKKCIDSWVKGEEMCSFSFLDRYLEAILKGYKSHLFCPAYVDTLAVWWNGDIYPCFMFWGVEEFKIGNIDSIKPEELKYSPLNKIPTKIEIKKCNECEIKWLCNICLGGVYNESDTIWEIPYYFCEWQKAIIKELIYWLAYTREISNLWDKLIKNLKLKHANF